MRVKCFECGKEGDLTIEAWCCNCGGAWEPAGIPPFDLNAIKKGDSSIWRYGSILGLDILEPFKRMGVGWTPLVPVKIFDKNTLLKLEYLSPSGSFKDRGVNTMVNQLISMNVNTIVEDSSGNAGASVAAHAARFGLNGRIFVPEYASPGKIKQIADYGVEVITIQGTRRDVEKAAQAAIMPGVAYASHAYHPAYLAGQVTAAYECWEQLGGKAPDWILLPVAQGGQFLGYWFGFSYLLQAGLIEKMPHMVAVQSAQVAPIFHAWRKGLGDIPGVEALGPTLAEGVAIGKPVRGKRILQALRETDGRVIAINETEIIDAQKLCSRLGYFIELTSALAVAGMKHLLDEITEEEDILLPLTGNGLKGVPKIYSG